MGAPPFSLLPLDSIQRAAQIRFAQGDSSFLQYGADQGDGYFRRALADFLSESYGFPVAADSLFVTNGISNGLDMLCTLFTQAGDVIFVEEPTYFLALRIFADHHLRVVSIDTDENGLVLESLRENLRKYRPNFLYSVPTFQNPTGRTLSQERRDELVGLAQEHDFMILADEVYHFFGYTQNPPKPFASYTDIEKVVSLNSFSKILAPGLRLGWMQAHPAVIQRLVDCGLLDSGGGLNPFTSSIVREIISSGDLKRNIEKSINIFRPRVALMDSLLQKYLPELTYAVPQGGYFFWARLPDKMDANILREKAASFKVDFRQGIKFSSRAGLNDYIRLCFVFYETEQVEEGLGRLKQLILSAD